MSADKLKRWRVLAADARLIAGPNDPIAMTNRWVHRETIRALGDSLAEACDEIERLEGELLGQAERAADELDELRLRLR